MGFVYTAFMLDRGMLHEGALNTQIKPGESLIAIIPFYNSNNVTVVVASRKPVSLVLPAVEEEEEVELTPEDYHNLEHNDA